MPSAESPFIRGIFGNGFAAFNPVCAVEGEDEADLADSALTDVTAYHAVRAPGRGDAGDRDLQLTPVCTAGRRLAETQQSGDRLNRSLRGGIVAELLQCTPNGRPLLSI
jgi:hypothetical protein